MLKGLPSLQKLANKLRHVPYLASKNLYRVALHFIRSDKKTVEQLCDAIREAQENTRVCTRCCNWTEQRDLCSICSDSRRDQGIICVVETWHDLFAIERGGEFSGLYHLLGGSLSPLDGVGPDDLTITELVERTSDPSVREIIFATNPTPEGEATASLILSKIKRTDIIFSRLASGMPTGASLEYMDRMTIYKALSGRRPF